MSVLKSRRTESKAEYINTAIEIYTRTINFLTRLSARYSRLLVAPIAETASKVVENVEMANNIYPSDDVRKKLREEHLLEARAKLAVLDVYLSNCYSIMALNPAGCFTTGSGKTIPPGEAERRLDGMAQTLGELIDKEKDLITGVLKSDKSR